MALRDEGFWDKHYEEELRNFNDDGDEGEVWFGRRLSIKIVDNTIALIKSYQTNYSSSRLEILDIGCGNLFLLTALAQKAKVELSLMPKTMHCLGLDYSDNSICLSEKILASKGLGSYISINQCDFLELEQVKRTTSGIRFDIVIDVGTFDAICLLSKKVEETQRAYMRSLYSVVKKGTVLFFASCNHTKEELLSLFEFDCQSRRDILLIDEIDTPKLKFGGREGSQVSCLIIKFNS